MFWIFFGLAIVGLILCLLVRQHIMKYGFPLAYCFAGIIACGVMCLHQFGRDINFDWYGYLIIVFMIQTWYIYHYFVLRS